MSERKISVGIDIDYTNIIVTIIDKKTYEIINVDGLNKELNTTICFDGKEFLLGTKTWKKGVDSTFLDEMITNPEEIRMQKKNIFDYEFEVSDETKLALLLHQCKTYIDEKGIIENITISIPNKCSLMAIEKIRRACFAAGMEHVDFIPHGLSPFVYLENFDPQTQKFIGYEKKHIIFDVTSRDITINFGKVNRKVNERKVELTKWKTLDTQFTEIMTKMRELFVEK